MTLDNDIETMNCLDVCRLLSGDSNSPNRSVNKHLADCDSCSSYAKQQNKLSNTLEQAINVSVPEGLVSRILLQQSINEKKHRGSTRNRLYAIAVSVLLSVGVASGVLFFNSPVSLEQVALSHVKDELHHLHDSNNVQLVQLNSLLKPFNMRLDSSIGKINYAGSCTIKKSKGVHIVVETKTGPVTILLMPGEFVKNRKLVDDAIFSGSVIPIENGSFAIIGGKRESFYELEQKFKYGISYI